MTGKFIHVESLLHGRDAGVPSRVEARPNPELTAAGWERRFTADSRRAEEAVEIYSKLGYDVRVEPLRSEEMKSDCTDCASLMVAEFKTIYTRKRTL